MFLFIRIHHECRIGRYSWLPNFYGITEDPQTGEFLMVLQYAKNGSLRKYLENNSFNLKWKEKLDILYGIAFSLYNIHANNYVHKDLHSGNILQF